MDLADGSLAEVEACLELCLDLNLLTSQDFKLAEDKRAEVGYLMMVFKKGLKEKSR